MKKSFTLVEILIVMSIVVIMIIIFMGTLNPIALFNKARDAQRKKDLYRIKISFEDYHNDIGCYPNRSKVDELNLRINCKSGLVFRPWLTTWPCDPNGSPYVIQTGDDENCPRWFKVLAVLENDNDKDIFANLGMGVGGTEANYGVSSGNVSIGEIVVGGLPAPCNRLSCYYLVGGLGGNCNATESCSAPNCYIGTCDSICQISCCGPGCP